MWTIDIPNSCVQVGITWGTTLCHQVLMAFRTPALLNFLGSSQGLFALLNTRRLFKAMVTAVDDAAGAVGFCCLKNG